MNHSGVTIKRHPQKFEPNSSRVLIRPFSPADNQRISNVIARAMTLSEEEVNSLLKEILQEFGDRHFDIEKVFAHHYEKMRKHVFTDREISKSRKLLIGSYFTSEYALESAALFNPSIVAHPDQSGLSEGQLRFVMSLRATGEGHISSIEFRSGILDAAGEIKMDPASKLVKAPEIIPNPSYERTTFLIKLHEMGFRNEVADEIMEPFPEKFTLSELKKHIKKIQSKVRVKSSHESRTLECATWLAESNYEIIFSPKQEISERIIFPISANESNGIEDARFVRFVDEDDVVTYYATYTAYNGRVILPQLLETPDFLQFKVITLNGAAVQNKGMALFPRKIDGKYAMISRQDGENVFIMFSENLHFWNHAEKLLRPANCWEFFQLGNCGSPIETEAGWLLLTHGVGPMRKYCIGAVLLDLQDPSRVLGRLKDPLLKPNENEREGYVPNVVYTCGALLHNDRLVIPYAMSDSATSIASVSIKELLEHLTTS